MEENYMDFVGFTLDGVHSSELGILRVSGGSRYTEDLLPTFTPKTVAIPGNDGTYYFGGNYTQKNIGFNIAFDSLTEANLRRFSEILSKKEMIDLIFDETPYKVYKVRIDGAPSLEYICFDDIIDGDLTRIYKGEGTLSFIAYTPFARSRHKFLNLYGEENVEEWEVASGMLYKQGEYDIYNEVTNKFLLFNPGVKESEFILKIPFDGNGKLNIKQIKLSNQDSGFSLAEFNTQSVNGMSDEGILINTSTRLIEGYRMSIGGAEIRTGTLYNQYVTEGELFKIPIITSIKEEIYLEIEGRDSTNISNCSLQYNYYYF